MIDSYPKCLLFAFLHISVRSPRAQTVLTTARTVSLEKRLGKAKPSRSRFHPQMAHHMKGNVFCYERKQTLYANLRDQGNGFDLDPGIAREPGHLDGRSGRKGGLKEFGIDLIHLAEIVNVLEEDRGLDHSVE